MALFGYFIFPPNATPKQRWMVLVGYWLVLLICIAIPFEYINDLWLSLIKIIVTLTTTEQQRTQQQQQEDDESPSTVVNNNNILTNKWYWYWIHSIYNMYLFYFLFGNKHIHPIMDVHSDILLQLFIHYSKH